MGSVSNAHQFIARPLYAIRTNEQKAFNLYLNELINQ
jgi:hypothetical protein